jgi:hypothetical protein
MRTKSNRTAPSLVLSLEETPLERMAGSPNGNVWGFGKIIVHTDVSWYSDLKRGVRAVLCVPAHEVGSPAPWPVSWFRQHGTQKRSIRLRFGWIILPRRSAQLSQHHRH